MARTNDRGIFEKKKGSDIWWIRYACFHQPRCPSGEHREVVGTKAQARDLYQVRKREARQANVPGLGAGARSVTFAQIMGDALEYCRRHAGYKNDVFRAQRMCSWWAGLLATALTPQEIELRFSTMNRIGFHHKPETQRRPVSNATFNRYRSQLSLTYQLAQRYGKVPLGFNPARLVALKKEPERVRWMTAEEEFRMREVLAREYPDRPWRAVLDIALNCGLRWGDQAAIVPQDREGQVLRVQMSKTGKPLLLDLNAIAAAALSELEEAARGGPLSIIKKPRRWFERALKLAGIKDLRWHDLRHTFATRLLQAGVPVEKVQRLLGHRSILMTLRYAHVVKGYHDDALTRLAEINERCALGGAPVIPLPQSKHKAKAR